MRVWKWPVRDWESWRQKSSNSYILLLSLENNPKQLMGNISNVNTTLCETFLHLSFILKVNIIAIDDILKSHDHLKSQLCFLRSDFILLCFNIFHFYNRNIHHLCFENFSWYQLLHILLDLFIINTCLYFFNLYVILKWINYIWNINKSLENRKCVYIQSFGLFP